MKKTIFTTAMLLLFVLMGTGKLFAQEGNRILGSVSGLTFTNSFVLPEDGGAGHYTITNTNNGTFVIVKHDVFNDILWSKECGINTVPTATNIQATSCVIDAWGDIAVLGNKTSPGLIRPCLLRVSHIDGSIMSSEVYGHTSPNNIFATSIKVASDNSYCFITTEITAANTYIGGSIINVGHTTPGTIINQGFITGNPPIATNPLTGSQIGLYDLTEVSNGVWAVCGPVMPTPNTNYDGFVFVYDLVNNNMISSAQYDLGPNGQDDNFDKIIRDGSTGDFYLATDITNGTTAEDISILKLNGNLDFVWERVYTANQNQRVGSLEFTDAGDILVGGRSFRSTGLIETGFAISLTKTGVTNWQKAPTGMGVITGSNFFRVFPSGNDFFYAGNTGGTNIFTSKEPLVTQASPCFQVLDYGINNLTDIRGGFGFVLNLGAHTTTTYGGSTPLDAALQIVNRCKYCYEEVQSDQEVVKINYTTITPGYYKWGANNQGTKYYVDGPILFGEGCILDITGVDVVFSEGSSITMLAGSELRINNSVLRSCSKDGTWDGIYIFDKVNAEINNSVFKNASNAIVNGRYNAVGYTTENNTQITNNQFSNCQTGVTLRNISLNSVGAVNNNVFYVDDLNLDYPSNGNVGNANQYVGIYATNVTDQIILSQNEFIYAKTTSPAKELYGVYSNQASLEISENKFTNCFRAVDVDNNLETNIENNKIEVTQNKADIYLCQIRVHGSGSDIYRIAGNKLTNYDNSRGIDFSPTGILNITGIYTDFSQNLEIYNNEIIGFNVGIQLADGINLAKVYSNTVTDALGYGIYAKNVTNTTIKCNVIDMDYGQVMNSTQFPIGIAYKEDQDAVSQNLDIRGNCVLNTATAIALEKVGNEGFLPNIENNYLYNYIDNGIYIDNFTGTIGTPGTATNAGRNTFVNHNVGGNVIDINNVSGSIVTEDGNYNVQSASPSVVNYTMAMFNFYSTASCGNYFDLNTVSQNDIENNDKCDLFYTQGNGNLVVSDGGNIVLNYEKGKPIGNINDPNVRLRTWAMASKLLFDNDTEEDKLIKAVNEFEKDENVRLLTFAYLNHLNGNYTKAAALVSQVKASDELIMAKNRIEAIIQVYSKETITEEDVIRVSQLTKEADFFANELRVVYGTYHSDLSYPFITAGVFNIKANNGRIIRSGELEFKVYPNPVNGEEISIDIALPNVSSVIYVRDITGRVVATQNVNVSAGTLNMSVSNLTNGIYFVSVETDEEVLATQKLVVTH